MSRFSAIAKATTLEVISEPLSLLLLSASLVLAVFAPAFHYHQFGEATRMARDAGFSALLIGGAVFAVAGTVVTFRRELEGGTAALALAHPISRAQFFLAKACGAYVAFALFALALCAVTGTIVNGARLGEIAARATGDVPKLWGPSYACGVATLVLPYVLGAVLNRAFRCRFALTAFLATVALGLGSLAYRVDVALLVRLAPALALLWIPPAVFVMAASAAAVRLKANASASAVALLVAAFLPFAGNYSLAEALAKGGSVSWTYVSAALVAALPALGAFVLLGVTLFRNQDL